MSISLHDELAAAEPKRDRFGRYLIAPAGGGKAVAHTRATTIAETLDDRYNLELWKMRQVAVGLAHRPDLLAQVAAHTTDDKKVLNSVCEDAMAAAKSASGANMGTALHRIIERLNRGEIDRSGVPEMFADRVDAYLDATEGGLTIRRDLVERVAVLARHTIAGTFDLGVEVGGELFVADLKTGSSVDAGARGFAVQLAIYANAETLYDFATDAHTPAPGFSTERAVIIHLPSGGGPCTMHWLDIAAGWEALEHAMWVRSWRKRKGLLATFDERPKATEAKVPARTVKHDFGGQAPTWTPPDEGGAVDLEKAKAGIKRAMGERGLDPGEGSATLQRWVREGDDAGRSWRITDAPTERRFTIYRGVVRMLAWSLADDDARTVLSIVLGEEVQPAMRVGMALGTLTIDEARRLIDVCDALNSGAGIRFDDDGRATLATAAA